MSKIKGNDPALPRTKEYTEGGKDFLDTPVIVHKESFGLTKREHFAAMALASGSSPEASVKKADELIKLLNI